MKIPVTNNTAMPIYVGSTMIPAGETFHFEEEMVPHHLRPATEMAREPEAPGDPLVVLLEGNVKTVVDALPGLALADIERLGELEQAGQARKGVLGAIADAQLSRADLSGHVASLSDEDLAAAIEDAKTDPNPDLALLAALEDEAGKRNPGSAD